MDTEKEVRKEKFLPGTESEEQFDRILSALSEWIDSRVVDIEVDLDGDIDINLPRESDKFLSSSKLKDLPTENVVGIVEYEIPGLLTGSLSDNVREWIVRSFPDKLLKNIEVMVERSKKVFRALGSEDLKQRSLLRKNTSAYVIEGISCRHGTYHHKRKNKEKIDVEYMTLEFTFTKPRSKMIFALDPDRRAMIGTRSEEVMISIDLHKKELEELIERLKKILEDVNE